MSKGGALGRAVGCGLVLALATVGLLFLWSVSYADTYTAAFSGYLAQLAAPWLFIIVWACSAFAIWLNARPKDKIDSDNP